MQSHILLEAQADVAYLTLVAGQPGKPPTLDQNSLDELAHHFNTIRASTQIRVVILRSASEKYFCVGANINVLRELTTDSIEAWVAHGHTIFDDLATLPVPVLARVEGYCLGGGLELALACDLIVASPAASFGQPEGRLGLVPGWGATWRLPQRIGVARAKQMMFSGGTIAAEEAEHIGLVNHVGESQTLDAFVDNFCTGVAQSSKFAVAQMKAIVTGFDKQQWADMAAAEGTASRACMAQPETQARITAFLEGRGRKK